MSRRRSLWVTFGIFITIGYLASVLGPALSDLADQVGVKEASMGALFTVTFLGGLLAQSSVGPLMDRIGARPLMLAGSVLLAFGVVAMLLSPVLGLMLGLGLVFGLGFGALDTGTNVLVAELYDNDVSILNMLHMFFGIGSIISPAVAGLMIRLGDSALPAMWIGFGMAIALIPGVYLLPSKNMTTEDVSQPEPAATSGPASTSAPTPMRVPPDRGNRAASAPFSYRSRLLWGLGVLLLLYVAAEAGMGAWTKSYVERSTSLSAEVGAYLTAGFWLALTAGRVAGIIWGQRFTAERVLGVCLVGAFGAALLLVLGTGSVPLTVLAILLLGFFFGPPYPTIMAITTAAFRSGPGKAASLVASLASLGGMVGPGIQGLLLDGISPASSVIFVAALCGAMVLLFNALHQYRNRTAAITQPTAAR